jgi:hypothetical protein
MTLSLEIKLFFLGVQLKATRVQLTKFSTMLLYLLTNITKLVLGATKYCKPILKHNTADNYVN